jgi:hypothetical protein
MTRFGAENHSKWNSNSTTKMTSMAKRKVLCAVYRTRISHDHRASIIHHQDSNPMDPAQQDKVASKDLFAHAQPSSDGLFAPQHLGVKDKGVAYQEFSGYEIMEREVSRTFCE